MALDFESSRTKTKDGTRGQKQNAQNENSILIAIVCKSVDLEERKNKYIKLIDKHLLPLSGTQLSCFINCNCYYWLYLHCCNFEIYLLFYALCTFGWVTRRKMSVSRFCFNFHFAFSPDAIR
jgi:hypothetical protein